MPPILVSVCIVSYNQEKFIGECIESVLAQKGNFNLEIIIGEDCSSDDTRKIIQHYKEKYPSIITALFHERNLGPTRNYISVHSLAKGKYVCHLDGDDYFLPGKIQLQLEVMEANTDCSGCSHDVKLLNKKRFSSSMRNIPLGKKTIEYFIFNMPFFAHSTKMYRRALINHFDNVKNELIDCDFHVSDLLKGPIYHIDQELGVYRENIGVSSNKDNLIYIIDRNMSILDSLNNIIDNKTLNEAKAKKLYHFACYACFLKNKKEMRSLSRVSLNTHYFGFAQYMLLCLSYIPFSTYIMRLFSYMINHLSLRRFFLKHFLKHDHHSRTKNLRIL